MDTDEKASFGKFVKSKRLALGKSLKEMSAETELAPAYLCDVENGNRYPPSKHLDKFIEFLHIKGDDLAVFYDLAGRDHNRVSPDLKDYIGSTEMARVALRKARDANISDNQWLKIIEIIDKGETTK